MKRAIEHEELIVPQVSNPNFDKNGQCGKANATYEDMGYEAEQRGRGHKPSPEEAYAIIRFCARCVVREDCLANAIIKKDKFGIQGGLTGKQRTRLLSEQDKATGGFAPKVWQEAVESAVHQQPVFERPKATRTKPKTDTPALQQQMLSFLQEQPDGVFAAEEEASVYDVMAERMDVGRQAAIYALKGLFSAGRVEKITAKGRRIAALRIAA